MGGSNYRIFYALIHVAAVAFLFPVAVAILVMVQVGGNDAAYALTPLPAFTSSAAYLVCTKIVLEMWWFFFLVCF